MSVIYMAATSHLPLRRRTLVDWIASIWRGGKCIDFKNATRSQISRSHAPVNERILGINFAMRSVKDRPLGLANGEVHRHVHDILQCRNLNTENCFKILEDYVDLLFSYFAKFAAPGTASNGATENIGFSPGSIRPPSYLRMVSAGCLGIVMQFVSRNFSHDLLYLLFLLTTRTDRIQFTLGTHTIRRNTVPKLN